jgi:hypothetical protein
LGAKLHDAKDPGADLTAMLQQVVSSVFNLMQQYEEVWMQRTSSSPAPLFGFPFDVGLEPVSVDVGRMIHAFQRSCQELSEIWRTALQPDTLTEIRSLASISPAEGRTFHINDELWVRIVFEFASTYAQHRFARTQLLQSLIPLYLGRVASFVLETETLGSREVEERIEHLCMSYEKLKPYLIALWQGKRNPGDATGLPGGSSEERARSGLEVRNV